MQIQTLIEVRIIIFWDFSCVSRCAQGLLATSTSDSVSMDTTISGGVFLNFPEILSILASADRQNRRPKARSNLPAPAPLECPARARAAPLRRLTAPSGSSRLGSALLCRARFAFGCFRSRKPLAAETLPARAADVGPAGS